MGSDGLQVNVPLGDLGFSVAWSPDGSRLLVGTQEGELKLLTSEGRSIRSVQPHSERVAGVAWHPEGGIVAAASWDDTLRVWSSRLESEIFVVESEADFNGLSFSPDGKHLASTSDDRHIWIVEVPSGEVSHRYPEPNRRLVYGVAWSPDSKRLATGSDGGTLLVWDALFGNVLLTLKEHSSGVMAIAWSPDGRQLCALEREGDLVAWEADSGRLIWRQNTDEYRYGYSINVSWSSDGRIIATVGDGPAQFFDARTGECVRTASDALHAGAFSPEGNRFATVGRSLEVYDVSDLTMSEAHTATGGSGESWFVRQAATVGRAPARGLRTQGARLSRENADGGRVVRSVEESGSPAVDLHPSQRRLAIGTESGGIRIVDLEAGAEDVFDGVHVDKVTCVAWSPDGESIATVSHDNSSAVTDAATGALITRFEGHSARVFAVGWSPDGALVASGSDDQSAVIWKMHDGSVVRRFEGQRHALNDLAWSHSGERLVSSGMDSAVRCWSAQTGREICRFEDHIDWVTRARWSSDDRRVASASVAGEIAVWDASSGQPIWSFGAKASVIGIAWSPSDRFVAFLEASGRLAIVEDGTSSDPVEVLPAPFGLGGWSQYHPGHLVWSHDGAYLAASRQGCVIVVDIADFGESAPPAERRSSVPGRLTPDLAALPGTLSALHRLRLPAPISLVRDVRSLLSGGKIDTPVGSLATLPGMRQLISLRWRGGALAGLVALLLRETQFDDWAPPADLHADELRRRLMEALRGEAIDPVDPEVSLTPIRQAAEAVDERLMTLLTTLGPEAVAADPGIVLRLLRHVPELPKLAEPQRRLLSLRVAPLEPGPAQGSGIGVDRTGISPSGPLTALLPSQLAYPRDLFIWRYRNRELLYRARTGREPPRLRPAVLVLDVSPASFGPIEGMTRPAAFVLASTLRRSGVPTVLVAAGGQERVHLLEQPADLVRLFTLRSQERADPERVMSVAQGVRGSLRDGALEPVVVLLTQPWWGEGETSRSPGHVRGLFVQYPGRPVRPAWADVCERWETIDSRDHDRLPQALGRLIA